MPIPSAVQDLVADAQTWRREIHQNPELLYDVELTAKYVADRLTAFGCDEVQTSIGRTGVVGVIRGARGPGPRTIGLRADMDALPIEEATNLPYRSRVPGKMHACGHDGHTAMLLGAARRLAQTRNFAGAAVVIFQPAEEGGAGAMAMIDDGLMDRFGIEEIYGMHNWPTLPVGLLHAAQGAAHGRGRRDHDHRRRPGRPRGDAASMRRSSGRRRADRARLADHRFAQRRSPRRLRGVDHPLRGWRGQQHHSAVGLAQRDGAHASGRHPRYGRKADPRDRRWPRRGGRRDGAGRIPSRLPGDRQSSHADGVRRRGRAKGRR